jgi:rhodanese-related sulfurtransferase
MNYIAEKTWRLIVKMSKQIFFAGCLVLLVCGAANLGAQQAAPPAASPAPAAVAQPSEPAAAAKPTAAPQDPKKHVKSDLYVSAKDAYAMWQADQANVKILDCRCPEEFAFVGHAPMAVNVPFKFVVYKWEPKKKEYQMRKNPQFQALAKKHFKPTDTILVMCRSGHRSAETVNALLQSGFKNVYNIVDGFEGDKEKDKNNPNNGKRTVDGWKNSGAPWTYDFNTELMYLIEKPKKEQSPS